MYMKKIISLLLACCLLIAVLSIAAFASEGAGSLLDKELDAYEEAIRSILEEKLKEDVWRDSARVDACDYENTLMVTIADPLLVTEYDKNKTFSEVLSDAVQWKVPLLSEGQSVGAATLVMKDGELQYSGSSMGDSVQDILPSIAEIEKSIADSKLDLQELEDCKFVYSYQYNTLFVFLRCGQQEYLIPCTVNQDIDLTNGRVYPAEELMRLFRETFDEEAIVSNANGGVPLRKAETLGFIPYVAVFIVAAVALTVVLKTVKKRETR